MTTPPDDVDALFDAPAPTSPAPSVGSHIDSPPVDNRREHRVKVSWPARVQLPGGKVLELRVRDLSENGVGFVTDHHIPPSTVLNFAMGVPGLDQPTKITPVTCTIKTSYVIVHNRDLHCGGTWVMLPPDSRDLLDKWIRRLRK